MKIFLHFLKLTLQTILFFSLLGIIIGVSAGFIVMSYVYGKHESIIIYSNLFFTIGITTLISGLFSLFTYFAGYINLNSGIKYLAFIANLLNVSYKTVKINTVMYSAYIFTFFITPEDYTNLDLASS